jgi:hypothetical protein
MISVRRLLVIGELATVRAEHPNPEGSPCMAPAVAVLLDQGLYRPIVPDQPTEFRIDSVSVEPLTPIAYVSTGPDSVIPTRFAAHFTLGFPEATATMEVRVDLKHGPMVLEIALRSRTKKPISTRFLRQVHVDKLLQKAVAEATVPSPVRTERVSSIPGTSTDDGQNIQADENVRTAARLWAEAVASGAKAPGEVVAATMKRSRSTISRYIRQAKELNLLPHTDA